MNDIYIQTAGIIIAAVISGVAAYYAAKAEKNSRSVGNGFTTEVLVDLRELREMMTTHLRDHSRHDV